MNFQFICDEIRAATDPEPARHARMPQRAEIIP